MFILALDAALARCSAAVLRGQSLLAARETDTATGHAGLLPQMADDVLAEAGYPALDMVAVTVGPGGFTGLRAALALAHGIGLAEACQVVGVTVPEALRTALPAGREVWVAIDTRRAPGHRQVFLDRNGVITSHTLDNLPQPAGRIAIAGDAAMAVAAALAAQGSDVTLTDMLLPRAGAIAAAAQRRLHGALPPLAAIPLYIDPPAARLPPPT